MTFHVNHLLGRGRGLTYNVKSYLSEKKKKKKKK